MGADFLLLLALILTCQFGQWSGFLRGVEIAVLCFVPVFATAAILSYVKANGWTKAAFLCVLWGTFFLFADALVSLIYHQPYAFKINLACWEEEYLNGNIIFVTWLSAFLCGLALFIVGIVKSCEKRKKSRESSHN